MADLKTNAKFEKNKDSNSGVLTFEIPVDSIKEGLDAAFNRNKNQISIPGFRKGKISKELFFQRFGEESLYQDVFNAVLPNIYDAAVDEAGVNPVGRPDITPEKMEKGSAWVLTAKLDLAPAVKLGEYKGVKVDLESSEVSQKEIDAELERMQKAQAELEVAEDGYAAQSGDTIVIDFDGDVDGDHFDGGKAENFSLALGSGQFIPGFEDQLIGHKSGEDVDVQVTFPEDYQQKDLAGKAAHFATKIHEIKKQVTPKLDDEFAKDADESVNTLSELKEKIRTQLTERKSSEFESSKEDAIVQKVVENAKVGEDNKIPQVMIDEDVARQSEQFWAQMQQQGISREMYFQISGQNEAELAKQFETEAEKRVRTNLVLEEVASQEKVSVDQKDIENEAQRLATMYQMDASQVRAQLSDSLLSHDLKVRKAVDLLVSEAKVAIKKSDDKAKK